MNGCTAAIAALLAAAALASQAAPPEPHADAIADEILANVAKLKASDPLAEPMAFWDFDGTIVDGDISTGLVRDGKEVFPGLVRMAIEAGYSPVYRGKEGADLFMDVEYPRFSKIGKWLAWPLIGQIFHGADAEDMDRFCRRRAEETFAPWVFSSSKRIIDRLAAAGVDDDAAAAPAPDHVGALLEEIEDGISDIEHDFLASIVGKITKDVLNLYD